jgi:hypothetical protein
MLDYWKENELIIIGGGRGGEKEEEGELQHFTKLDKFEIVESPKKKLGIKKEVNLKKKRINDEIRSLHLGYLSNYGGRGVSSQPLFIIVNLFRSPFPCFLFSLSLHTRTPLDLTYLIKYLLTLTYLNT